MIAADARRNVRGERCPDEIRRVTVNGTTKQFDLDKLQRIRLNGKNGNDAITVDETNGAISVPTTLFGGNGSDSLTGGSGNDVLQGANGDDVLTGQ